MGEETPELGQKIESSGSLLKLMNREGRDSSENVPTPKEDVGAERVPNLGVGNQTGVLILNADDWGRDPRTTDAIFKCFKLKAISSVSAMVFMEDSERAAAIALENGVDAGLHLNLTSSFSPSACSQELLERHGTISSYLRQNRFSRMIYNPFLRSSFRHVVAAQFDEFQRLYGRAPNRVDGHHHMHLCANVLHGKLLPVGIIARRNFSFQRGEKGLFNRLYRRASDRALSRRHPVVDYFFSLPPLKPFERLQRIFSLAREHSVEVETHPINPEEYRFLTEGEIFARIGDLQIAPKYRV
ncbi:MAG: hypothetical protein NVS9B5_27220 [Terriglobales bacterium]